ncbi:MAG TPA: cysteine desulfurase family protein [Candidatus Eisenbacteria bacterium]|nr:cysteine desulfurase family protein [Candidatus Eisenbacteria bacterium]
MLNYFDHTATKLMDQDVIDYFAKQLKNNNYNSAARYSSGIEAAASIEESTKKISSLLGANTSEVIYTSGGSESINTALKGIVFAPNPKHKRILTTAGEHAATIESLKFIKDQLGYSIDICDLNKHGMVDLGQVKKYLSNYNYDLLTLIHVNNVLGSVNPIEAIVDLRNRLQADLPIHLDAVQSLGKIPFNFKDLGVELASFSLHKIGAPKGIGLLLKSDKIRLEPLIHGGGQQNNLRSGTENPAMIATIAYLLEKIHENFHEKIRIEKELKTYFIQNLLAAAVNFHLISPEDALPQIISICFPELRAETLLNILDRDKISISIGSACSNKKSEQNSVLRNLKLPNHMDQHILRISIDRLNTKEEIDYLVIKIKEALAKYAI